VASKWQRYLWKSAGRAECNPLETGHTMTEGGSYRVKMDVFWRGGGFSFPLCERTLWGLKGIEGDLLFN
jgi:hypothetical protein